MGARWNEKWVLLEKGVVVDQFAVGVMLGQLLEWDRNSSAELIGDGVEYH